MRPTRQQLVIDEVTEAGTVGDAGLAREDFQGKYYLSDITTY